MSFESQGSSRACPVRVACCPQSGFNIEGIVFIPTRREILSKSECFQTLTNVMRTPVLNS